jgi:tRNA (cytidine/uridine-2'-O-)-methyltransferase
MSINIVLYEPEIPQNTGNIVRTCAATGAKLHLIKPLGFSFEDKYLKRSGLDYWDLTIITIYENFQELLEKYPQGRFIFCETHTTKHYTDFEYQIDDFLVFGKETTGIPGSILENHSEMVVRLPMRKEATRSLNLSNCVAILAYEALRQIGFPKMY